MATDNEIITFVISWTRFKNSESIGDIFGTLNKLAADCNLDSEFVIVNSNLDENFDAEFAAASSDHPVQFIVVGEKNTWDQEIFAGLSRANGDYIFTVGESVNGIKNVLLSMLTLAKRIENDIVGTRIKAPFPMKIRYFKTYILLGVLRRKSEAPINMGNCRELLLTRKALNWIIRDLSSAQSMLEMFLIPGLKFEFVESEFFGTKYRLTKSMYLRLLMRYTNFSLIILRSIFYLTATIMLATALNSALVTWYGSNLLGDPETRVPGWTTLVLLISFGFSVTVYSLFTILRAILYIGEEYSSKPRHIIKYVRRS